MASTGDIKKEDNKTPTKPEKELLPTLNDKLASDRINDIDEGLSTVETVSTRTLESERIGYSK